MRIFYPYVFFFSSRRRHTRFKCDWSSDVCSSDLGVVERVSHTDALDRVLLDSVDENRLGQAGQFENGRRDVNYVSELAADLAFPLDSLGPVHNCSVASAPEM